MGNRQSRNLFNEQGIPVINLRDVQSPEGHKCYVPLGGGGFGKVYKGIYKTKEVAIKIFHDSYQVELSSEQLQEWMESMKQLCDCLGVCIEGKQRGLIMEFINRGNLRQFINNQGQLSAKKTLWVVRGVCRALIYLHTQRIIHRDIKPQNILIHKKTSENGSSAYVVKLTDYDLTQQMVHTQQMTPEMRGTIRYTPPELYSQQMVSHKSDIYSVGMVAYECITGNQPWDLLCNEIQVVSKAVDGQRPELPDDIDENVKSLICDCWDQDPTNRPTADQLLIRCNQLIQQMNQ
eukprot:TRINITY_DN3144_c1_g1_i1.p1 TRINITY_DN3144_c1_g1~~TRINITY_DN3144_c1_g1_i1.p1  ORF type:complete len:291 (-),score=16.26 TRINITY_DN3144_c1_g1_i1:247-1119(-)